MSSLVVRNSVKSFLATNAPTVKVSDLTGGFEDIADHLAHDGISFGAGDIWVGIQFIGNDESPVTINSTNSTGKYRESGAIYIHVVDIAKTGARDSILARAETLRNLFRGRRLVDAISILSVTPPSFEMGATLDFEAGYISASFIVEYEYDINL